MPTHPLRRARSTQLLLTAALAWLAAGCAATVSTGSPPEPVSTEGRHEEGAPLGIPRGHLPPPGECRIWYPDQPPGQQPPPLSCHEAMTSAPRGTWVLYRPQREEVHARVLDPRRAGVVVQVRVFAAEDGRYLRRERP